MKFYYCRVYQLSLCDKVSPFVTILWSRAWSRGSHNIRYPLYSSDIWMKSPWTIVIAKMTPNNPCIHSGTLDDSRDACTSRPWRRRGQSSSPPGSPCSSSPSASARAPRSGCRSVSVRRFVSTDMSKKLKNRLRDPAM